MCNCGSVLSGRNVLIPPTPVSSLLDTNDVPSPLEESAIRALLVNMNSDLSQLDGEIGRVQAVLQELRMKRQVLNDSCQKHKGLISSIRRFPPEILSEIFMRSLPDDWKYNTRYFRLAVLLPASVSRHWRNVALSTPSLWSSISLRLVIDSTIPSVDWTRTCLSRSGGVPLSIRLVCDDFTTLVHPVIDILIEHAERWQHADLTVSHFVLNHIRSVKNRLPRLRTLAITPFYASIQHVESTTLIDTFEVAPQVTSLTIGHSFACHILSFSLDPADFHQYALLLHR